MVLSSEPGNSAIALVGTFWVLDLAPPLPDVPAPRLPVTFLRLVRQDAGELARAMCYDDAATVQQRFDAGKHCYGGKIENEIATYGWVTFDQETIGELGMNIHLAPGDAYIWDCATLSAYRGQSLYTALLASITRFLRAKGLRRVWIGADADNLASQAGMMRAGFLPVADMLRSPESPVLTLRGRPEAAEQLVHDIRAALKQ
jgi:RimJ/RimL family protein N-acetyltransferase